MSIISALRRLKQEDYKYEASLGYQSKANQTKPKPNKIK
jgi:hypothetical protein